MTSTVPPVAELIAPGHWRTVDCISDLHLVASEPATFAAWQQYMAGTTADAVCILGDLFEVWVGDDAVAADPGGFDAACMEVLRAAARQRPVFFMHGNRDFLVGRACLESCGVTLLDDPTVLVLHGQRWLLSHGDILCLDDTDYLKFRAMVRTPEWQAAFLARPLAERRALARSMRAQSEDRKRNPSAVWADVDGGAARQWLQQARAGTLVHGHTHRPADHDLGDGLRRIVLSDWDAAAHPPRAQLLCLSTAGAQRVDLR